MIQKSDFQRFDNSYKYSSIEFSLATSLKLSDVFELPCHMLLLSWQGLHMNGVVWQQPLLIMLR